MQKYADIIACTHIITRINTHTYLNIHTHDRTHTAMLNEVEEWLAYDGENQSAQVYARKFEECDDSLRKQCPAYYEKEEEMKRQEEEKERQEEERCVCVCVGACMCVCVVACMHIQDDKTGSM